MPSPFPGMDPFVESPTHWSDFHPTFIQALRDAINEQLPDGYHARIDEMIMMISPESEPPGKKAIPDVLVTNDGGAYGSASKSAGVTTHDPTTIANIQLLDPVTETFIRIVRMPDGKVVTEIDLLSPTNKSGEGRGLYLEKRDNLLRTDANIVELDLIRAGPRIRLSQPLPIDHYYCFISRGDRRSWCEVYHWSIRDRLPKIPVPLQLPDDDMVIDLQTSFEAAFDRGRYDDWIDYAGTVPPPLSEEDAAWGKQIGTDSVRRNSK